MPAHMSTHMSARTSTHMSTHTHAGEGGALALNESCMDGVQLLHHLGLDPVTTFDRTFDRTFNQTNIAWMVFGAHLCLWIPCVYRRVCRHVHRHACLDHVCVQTCVQACVQTCVQVCAQACVQACVCAGMCAGAWSSLDELEASRRERCPKGAWGAARCLSRARATRLHACPRTSRQQEKTCLARLGPRVGRAVLGVLKHISYRDMEHSSLIGHLSHCTM